MELVKRQQPANAPAGQGQLATSSTTSSSSSSTTPSSSSSVGTPPSNSTTSTTSASASMTAGSGSGTGVPPSGGSSNTAEIALGALFGIATVIAIGLAVILFLKTRRRSRAAVSSPDSEKGVMPVLNRRGTSPEKDEVSSLHRQLKEMTAENQALVTSVPTTRLDREDLTSKVRAINVLAIQLGRTLETESRKAPAPAIQAAIFETVRQRVFDTTFFSASPAAKSLNSVQLEGRFSSPAQFLVWRSMTAAALDRSTSAAEKDSGIKRLARAIDESASAAAGLQAVPTKLQSTVKDLAGAVADLAFVLSSDPRGYRALIPLAGSAFEGRTMLARSGKASGVVAGTESVGLANADGSAVEKATVTVQ